MGTEKKKKKARMWDFLPSIIATPINPIVQTYVETKNYFPDLSRGVYYGRKPTFFDKMEVVPSKDRLLSFLGGLDKKGPKVRFPHVVSAKLH
ncbi:hypothetical protein FALBO_14929 [Fusarium albosuccineum]|uniref:Uncharacterized protein n=1 Tax=Fusarium albosuccineum TaxID=1237068 RepID=A0A8H4KXZ2_9HYPO|nr:hypothetical protein FALBO_14929 [Fusarium albosuccineum]